MSTCQEKHDMLKAKFEGMSPEDKETAVTKAKARFASMSENARGRRAMRMEKMSCKIEELKEKYNSMDDGEKEAMKSKIEEKMEGAGACELYCMMGNEESDEE
eukprot:GHVN01077302.1.p1 GENE.GHVN01077302.1~~GHVN01077302.1.p1  ORF type:complete len:103 (+),score=28.06 GHVN01077302.1:94-402(+)